MLTEARLIGAVVPILARNRRTAPNAKTTERFWRETFPAFHPFCMQGVKRPHASFVSFSFWFPACNNDQIFFSTYPFLVQKLKWVAFRLLFAHKNNQIFLKYTFIYTIFFVKKHLFGKQNLA
jgi:hypothetical protein